AVDDPLRDGLLTLAHDRIHELRDHLVPKFGVGIYLAFLCAMAAGHGIDLRCCSSTLRRPNVQAVSFRILAWHYHWPLDHFGRLAPYFERLCFRFLTPCVSSTPRRMW